MTALEEGELLLITDKVRKNAADFGVSGFLFSVRDFHGKLFNDVDYSTDFDTGVE